MASFDEQECLMTDPFEGDYGGDGAGDRVLSDKIVTFRKDATCHLCAQPVKAKTRGRSRAEVYDGELMAFRWCEECCKAMAESDDDTLNKRYALRESK